MPVAELSPRALELARTLVRLNTVSANSNLELIHFARDELARLGVASRLTYNAERTKANLFATLGEGKPAGLILSGHTDTVPWDGQDWSVDPLGAVVKDGRLYGRGSADMKSFIAIALSHAEAFLASEAPFAIHFAFSYDEEVGCFGVRELIADMREAGVRPVACIIGEPTSMVPAIAHKGVYRY
jgi:acetylornithine deacetylase